MKYTRTALGLLTRQYRSVLKKCFLINIGLFMLSAPVKAATTVTTYDALLSALAGSSTADVILDRSGAGVTITGNGFTISGNQKVALKNIGTAGSSSWTNGSGTDYEHRTPSEWLVRNDHGTLSIDNVIIDNPYMRYPAGSIDNTAVGIIRNVGGTVTGITNTTISNAYALMDNGYFGGVIRNMSHGVIDLIQNVTIKDIAIKTVYSGAPHGGAVSNSSSTIKNINGLTIENVYMEAHAAQNETDTNGGGGNHGVLENQTNAIIGTITNLTMKGNFLYKPGEYDITPVYANNHASAAGIYNLGNIQEISHALFQDNHTKMDMKKASSTGGGGGGAAIMSFIEADYFDDLVTTDNYVGIGKMNDVQFIHNYVENYAGAHDGAVTMGSGAVVNDQWVIGHTSEFTNATFDGNYAHSTGSYAYAGALRSGGIIDVFTGEFKNNYAQGDGSYAQGGALYMESGTHETAGLRPTRIGSLTANFTGNYAKAKTSAQGGAIRNTAIIETLTGNFSSNYTDGESRASGGAIYNGGVTNYDSKILTINGNFTGNHAYSLNGYAGGGAINDNNHGVINSITGDFNRNYAKSDGTGIGSDVNTNVRGGAVFNVGHIGLIDGDFTDNYAQAAGFGSFGGAIFNSKASEYSTGIIDSVTGTYQNNQALATNFSGIAQGGAVYNGKNATIGFNDADFLDNNATSTGAGSTAQGGAIYNLANIAEISDTTFRGNFAKSEQSRENKVSGGAITTLKGEGASDSYTGIAKINNSSFENNYAQGYAGVYGGAISAGEGIIGNVTNTDFTENYATSATSFAYGGALKNSGIINSLGGSFTGNNVSAKTYARGGAIYNERNEGDSVSIIFSNADTANIKAINATFKDNYAHATNNSAFGGAIYNTALIGAVNGDFLRNYASSNSSYAAGGAAYIGHISLTQGSTTNLYNSKITSFNGNFSENYAQGTNAIGGAIYNNGTLAIDNINGTFTDNRAIGNTEYAYGGAIYNAGDSSKGLTATISNITGTYTGNYAKAPNKAAGGAIYNGASTSLAVKDSSFSGNYAQTTGSTESNAQGGAIYNAGLITFKGTNTFKDNLSKWGTQTKTNDIYNIGTISLDNSSILNTYGGIDGSNGVISAEAGSKINVYSDVLKNNTVTLKSAQITLGSNTSGGSTAYGNVNLIGLNTSSLGGSVYANNGAIAQSILGVVNLGTTLGYKIDANAGTKTSDTIKITGVNNASVQKIRLEDINVLGSTPFSSITDINYKMKILDTPNNNIQLELGSVALDKLGGERIYKTIDKGSSEEDVEADTDWNRVYRKATTYEDHYARFRLDTTTTTNDSIGLYESRYSNRTERGTRGDTLVLVNADTLNTNKTFNATTSAPNYTLSDNLTATQKKLTINGLGASTSTLDLNGHTGFSVSGSGNTLTLKNLTLTSSGSNSTLASSTTLGLNGVTINNSIAVTNTGTANLSGTNTINSTIGGSSGSTNVNSGTTTLNAKLTQKDLTVASGATLNTNAGNLAITNAIANSGTLQFNGGALSQAVNGTGRTNAVGGDTLLNAKLTQNNLTISSGATLTTNANNLAITNAIANSGNLQLTGGTLSQAVNGTGSTTAQSGTTTLNAALTQNNLTINSGATLNTNAGNLAITNAIANSGTLQLTGGTLSQAVNGTGSTTAQSGTTTLGAKLTQNNLTINSGATLNTNAGNLAIAYAISNSGALQLTGGTLNADVIGTGSTTAQSGATTLGGSLTQKDLTVASGATFSANANNLTISNAIADNGTLQLSGGTLSQSVSGTGALNLTGNTTLAAGKTISTNSLNLGTSTLTVNNTANNAINVSAFTNSGASGLNLNNNQIQSSALGAVNLAGNVTYKMDINPYAKTADTLTASSVNNSSTGKVMIDSFNVLGSTAFADITDENFKIKILNTPSDKLQLALGTTAQSQLGGERIYKTEQGGTTSDPIKQTTTWGETYYQHTTFTDYYGKIDLATTTTTNDSIGMKHTGTDTRIVDGALDNTLILVNADTTNATKYFNATSTAPNYTLGDNLTATKGNMNITGLGAATSTLNLNGKTGFNVSGSGNTLNLKDLTLTSSGSNSTLNNSTTLGLNGVTINNSIAVTNNGTANLSGTNTINSTIGGSSGSTNVNSGTTTLNAKLTQNNLTIASGATLKTNANNLAITNAIANSGALQLTGGTLSQAVNGTGSTTAQSGTTTLNAKLTQNNLTVASGATLNTNADNLAISNAIADNGTLQLSGGTLSQSVGGTGALNLTGNTTLAAGKTISTNSLNLGTSTLTVNNTANNAINVSAFTNSGASGLNLNNNQIQSSALGAVNLAGNVTYKMDINPYAKTADTLTASSVNNSSTGKVMIDSFNVLGSTAFADITDENFKIKILNTPSDKLQLALGTTAQSQLGSERLLKEETTGVTPDSIRADNTWGDKYELHTTITYTYGRLGLQTTTTTNDSIGMRDIRQVPITYDSDLGDTLRLVAADTTNENKTFAATDEHPNYTVSGTDAVTVNKELTINGLGKTSSVLDLDKANGFRVTDGSTLNLKDMTIKNGSGPISGRNPTVDPIVSNNGTLSIDKVTFDDIYNRYLSDYTGLIHNEGHITGITNSDFTNIYITTDVGGFGGVIKNMGNGIIDKIQNVNIKNVTWKPDTYAPHGGAIANYDNGYIAEIDNVSIENVYMETHRAANAQDATGGGGNHGVLENNHGGHIGTITNLTMKGNYLYRPGEDDISAVYSNLHASAAGIYNQGNIDEISHALFQDNHTKTEIKKLNGGGAGGDGAIASFLTEINGTVTADNYVGIGKLNDVRFIHNYVENYVGAGVGAIGIGSGIVDNGKWIIGHTTEFTNAYFEGNFAHSIGSYAYAGAMSSSGIIDVFTGEFKNNYAQGDGDYAQGGALRTSVSYDEIVGYSGARIGSLTADFTGNYTQAKNSSSGGAILNSAQIGTLSGDFSTNHSASSDSAAYGGAILNETYAKYSEDVVRGYIKSITGDFTENYTSGALNSLGGAIMNRGKMDSITGDFIGNHSYSSAFQARGGAIYNGINNSSSTLISELGSITAKDKGFKENYTYSVAQSAFGGAVYNSQGNIESIDADFTGNYAQSDAATYKASGGALYNNSTIDDITGDFSSNYTLAVDYAAGGAINNNHLGEIGTISGDFSDNYAKSTGTGVSEDDSTYARGGAIFNAGHIEKITGDFSTNKAESAGIEAKGGAIYQLYGDEGSIGIDEISGTFTSNGAKNTNASGIAYGGAIYNSENMAITIKDSTFTHNYVHSTNIGADNVKGGAIYNAGNLTFKGTNTFTSNQLEYSNGSYISISMNDIHNTGTIGIYADSIISLNSGLSGENGIINMGNNSRLNLRRPWYTSVGNTINLDNAYLNILRALSGTINHDIALNGLTTTANGGTLDTVDNYIQKTNLGAVNLAGNLNYKTDIELNIDDEQSKVDTLTAASINASSTGKVMIDSFNLLGTTTFDDITDENYKIQILDAPSDKLQLALSETAQNQLGDERETKVEITDVTPDAIMADTSWDHEYLLHTTYTHTYGKLGLQTTNTTNDSIGMNKTRDEDIVIDTHLGDTLRLVADDATNQNKTFNATADNPNYTVEDGDTELNVRGNLDINGVGKDTSTLDLGDSTFTLLDDASLGLNNLTVNNSRDMLIDGQGSVSADASELNGNIRTESENSYSVKLTDSTLNGNMQLINRSEDITDVLGLQNSTVNGDIDLTDKHQVNIVNANINGDITSHSGRQVINLSGDNNLNSLIIQQSETDDIIVSSNNTRLSMLEDTFAESNLQAANTTFNLDNGTLENYKFKQLNDVSRDISTNLYNIDFDVTNQKSDQITVLDDSAATITINNINIINGSFDDLPQDMTGKEFMVHILNSQNDNTQLALNENSRRQLPSGDYEIGREVHNRDDVLPADVNWNDKFYHKTQDEVFYGNIGLATTHTKNDSIGLTLTGSYMEEIITHEPLGDTLRLLSNNKEYTDKTFTTDNPHSTYKVGEDIGMTYGNLLISGAKDAFNTSTIDLDGHKGFDVTENSAVTLKDVKLINSGDDTVIRIQKDGKLVLDNAPMNNVNITVDGHLDITNSLVNVKNAAFGSDAILSLKINTLDDYGLFVADSVSFADKAHFKVTLADNLVKIGEEVDIQLLRSSEGNFAAFDDTFDNNLYHFTRKNDDGWYTIRLVKTARQLVAENGGSLTQQDAAGAWVDSRRPNKSEFAEKFRDAAQNDVNKFIDNLTAIAPSEAPIVQAMEADNDGLFSMIATHLRNDQYVANPVGYNAYAPYQQYPQYQRPVYYRQQYRAPQQYQPRYDANGYTYGLPSGDLVNPAQIWLNAYKGKAKFSDGQRQSFDTDKTGIVAALEKRFTPSFKAAAGYSYETGKVDAFQRDVDVDSHKLFAFYEYKPNHFFINGAVAYAMSSYKEDKEVFDKSVHASYDTTTISAQTLLGYETRYFTPEMGVRAYFIDRDGYTDSAEQKVTSNNMSIVRGVAGVRAGVDIDMGNCRKLRPELYVGVNYDFVGDKDEAVITLPNGETYSMEGRSLGKFGIETGAGISADFTQRFSLSARYAGDYRDKYKSHTGMIGMKYKF